MAKQYFRVVEDSYINNTLIKGDGKTVVQIETDPKLKGMIPKGNLVRVNEDGSDYVPEVRAANLVNKAKAALNETQPPVAPPPAADAQAPAQGSAEDLA